MEYIAPEFRSDGFNCPFCGTYAEQIWKSVSTHDSKSGEVYQREFMFCECHRCHEHLIWKGSIRASPGAGSIALTDVKMLFPLSPSAPLPNEDMPPNVKTHYEEARNIVSLSPRGASALLRLSIQFLMKHLGEKGENINNDIGNLVKKGLPPKIQMALDAVRVIGNNMVHPGVFSDDDTTEIAGKLFKLVNIIVDNRISQEKHIDEAYGLVPASQKDQIEKRDGKKP